MLNIASALTIAFLIDCIVGDPRSKYHPVVLIGTLISFFEEHLLIEKNKTFQKRVSGCILVSCILCITYGLSTFILLQLHQIQPWFATVIGILMLSFMISPRSLSEAGIEIRNFLMNHDLENARIKVGWIVGRDTDTLDEAEITRATVETIAENIVDGIISPFFYFLIGGAPLAIVYRAVNTMDSMIGYKNNKYIDFGKCAARLDDILNFIPARITSLLILCIAFIMQYNYKNAFNIIWRDASKHPSPNGGYSEAAVAGALNIRLGGLNYYFGQPYFRAYMGDEIEILKAEHINKTIRIMYGVSILFILFVNIGCWLIGGY